MFRTPHSIGGRINHGWARIHTDNGAPRSEFSLEHCHEVTRARRVSKKSPSSTLVSSCLCGTTPKSAFRNPHSIERPREPKSYHHYFFSTLALSLIRVHPCPSVVNSFSHSALRTQPQSANPNGIPPSSPALRRSGYAGSGASWIQPQRGCGKSRRPEAQPRLGLTTMVAKFCGKLSAVELLVTQMKTNVLFQVGLGEVRRRWAN